LVVDQNSAIPHETAYDSTAPATISKRVLRTLKMPLMAIQTTSDEKIMLISCPREPDFRISATANPIASSRTRVLKRLRRIGAKIAQSPVTAPNWAISSGFVWE